MKLLKLMKDGGKESRVWGYFLIEAKRLFSIILLRFEDGSREAYHSHAFNAISWVLKGHLVEDRRFNDEPVWWKQVVRTHFKPSLKPVVTTRSNMHRVTSSGRTWVLSFRGPWQSTWREWLPQEQRQITLTHGRHEV